MPYIDRLKAIKDERDLTNQEIASLSGIPLATITRIFNGSTQNPTFETFAQIAIALGASLDEIAGLRQVEAPPVDAHIENTLLSYADLLKEKEERLKEKDEVIAMLQDRGEQDRKERRRVLWFCGLFVGLVLAFLFVDVLNGDFGYFRY